MTLEFRIECLQAEIKAAEEDLGLKYKKLAVLRAELDKQRHDTLHPSLVATASD